MKEKNGKKGRGVAWFGLAVMAFALVGLFAVGYGGVRLTVSLLSNDKLKGELEDFLAPVVILDPPAFDSPDQLDERIVRTAAIWHLVRTEDLSRYQMDSYGFFAVPATDIERHAVQLFGEVPTLQHDSIQTYTGDLFSYSEEAGCYIVPSEPQIIPYIPEIDEITRSGDTYTLRVGYIPYAAQWSSGSRRTEISPDKYLTAVVVRQEDGSFRLSSLSNTERVEDNTSSAQTVSQASSVTSSDASGVLA